MFNKTKKDQKIKNKIIERRHHQISLTAEYLIDSFYLNPNRKIDRHEIYNEINIEDKEIVDAFLDDLLKKKKIIGKSKFLITFDGLTYLQDFVRGRSEYTNSCIALILSIGSFAAVAFGILNSDFADFMTLIIYCFIIFIVNKTVSERKENRILKKSLQILHINKR